MRKSFLLPKKDFCGDRTVRNTLRRLPLVPCNCCNLKRLGKGFRRVNNVCSKW